MQGFAEAVVREVRSRGHDVDAVMVHDWVRSSVRRAVESTGRSEHHIMATVGVAYCAGFVIDSLTEGDGRAHGFVGPPGLPWCSVQVVPDSL